MKKLVLLFGVHIFASQISFSQKTEKPQPMQEQMERMQKEMMKSFGKMFDSTQLADIQMDTNSIKLDTSFNNPQKSFGFSFDGNGWKQFTPQSDSTMGDMFKQFQEGMGKMSPDGSQGFNFFDMFKGFQNMMPGALSDPMQEPKRDLPDSKKKSETPDKKKKYTTESL